jgi:enhancing lycopene biosynthesis protein 2
MKQIGVILAGCGIYDGSETHEAVLTLLSIDNAGATAVCFAPDIEQYQVIDHRTGEVVPDERRNVLVESARLVRGKVFDLTTIDSSKLDALILPGGYGAAKNLCDYALRGTDFEVLPSVASAIAAFRREDKPIGFICVAPVIAARIFGSEHVELTIGNNRKTADDIESFGARNIEKGAEEIVVSSTGKIVSTPAYMIGTSIRHVAKGIDALVRKVIELC